MDLTPRTPPYDFQQYHVREEHLPSIKRMFESIDHHQPRVQQSAAATQATFVSHPPSPPDLLHDSEEDDENSLSTPSVSSSPKQSLLFPINDHDLICNKNRSATRSDGFVRPIILPPPHNVNRRKSAPRRSPSITGDVYQISAYDRSVVFQLNSHMDSNSCTIENNYAPSNQSVTCLENCGGVTCDSQSTSTQVICGQSLLSALREKVAHARIMNYQQINAIPSPRRNNKRTRTVSIIEIPKSQQQLRRESNDSFESSPIVSNTNLATTIVVPQPQKRSWVEEPYMQQRQLDEDYVDQQQHQAKRAKKSSPKPTHRRQSSSGRPSRVKGPCQACHEASDGCMRKAFNWPFPASQIFNDKGKPFVYLCNKCGLR